jgi:hypothetical protein
MSDQFLGSWLVSEYIYNPDGSFAGMVRQRRELLQMANGRIRISQHCTPEAALQNHPMGAFAGEWLFEMSVDGRYRRYHGPDVIGSGTTWGDGVMTGRGLWPRFGHNFRSFAILATPTRQLTGGSFYKATEMVANIVGVAVPEAEASDWPTLRENPELTTANWRGTARTVLLDGTIENETQISRHYRPDGLNFEETSDERYLQVMMDGRENYLDVQVGKFTGLGKRYGPMLQIEATTSIRQDLEWLEIFDAETNHLFSLRRRLQDGNLEKMEMVWLKGET